MLRNILSENMQFIGGVATRQLKSHGGFCNLMCSQVVVRKKNKLEFNKQRHAYTAM